MPLRPSAASPRIGPESDARKSRSLCGVWVIGYLTLSRHTIPSHICISAASRASRKARVLLEMDLFGPVKAPRRNKFVYDQLAGTTALFTVIAYVLVPGYCIFFILEQTLVTWEQTLEL